MSVKVAFYKGLEATDTTIYDKAICYYTKGQYSHTELVLFDSISYSSSPRDGGVRRKKIIFDDKDWDFIEIDNIDVNKIVKFFNLTENDKYDWIGIFGFIVPFKDRTNAWFCSEWVSNALKIAGYESLWNKESSKIHPNMLYNILTKRN